MGDNHIQPKEKAMFSRRDVLATAAAGAAMSTTAAAAASFGNPDNPPLRANRQSVLSAAS